MQRVRRPPVRIAPLGAEGLAARSIRRPVAPRRLLAVMRATEGLHVRGIEGSAAGAAGDHMVDLAAPLGAAGDLAEGPLGQPGAPICTI